MKIFLVGRQEWKRKDDRSGEIIEGLSYIGFTPGNKAMKFTSLEEYVVYPGEVEFDAKRAQEVSLLTKLFGGEVKYQDAKSYAEPKL